MLIDIKLKVFCFALSKLLFQLMFARMRQTNRQTNEKVSLCFEATAAHHDIHHRVLESCRKLKILLKNEL
jgi:hypothetical protein